MHQAYFPLFACKWSNAAGATCTRSPLGDSGYCRLHLIAHRLTGVWDPDINLSANGRQYFKNLLILMALYFPASVFFTLGRSALMAFGSGQYPNSEINYSPVFISLFFGSAFIWVGKLLSGLRRHPPSNGAFRWFYLVAVVLFGVSVYLSVTNNTATYVDDCLFIPLAIILYRLETRTGYVAGLVVLGGLALIGLTGLTEVVLDLSYLLFGGYFHIGTVAPELRTNAAALGAIEGLASMAVALDGAVALLWSGQLLTWDLPAGSTYDRFIGRSLPRVIVYATALMVVILGQCLLLRQWLLPFFGFYVFDRIPGGWVLLVASVIGLHLWIAKRLRKRRESPELSIQ